MRESIASVALIREHKHAGAKWLTRWNDKWQAYSFVAGHVEPGESFRDCVVREVKEELGLRNEVDFVVASQPGARVEFVAWSARAKADTAYTMELFELDLIRPEALDIVHSERRNRWLSEEEIRKGFSADGHPVSETVGRLLDEVGWMKGHRQEGEAREE